MSTILTDKEITKLINEQKILPSDWRSNANVTQEKSSNCITVTVIGENNNIFVLKLRQNRINSSNFCLTLGLKKPNTNKLFILRRYDSKEEHTNLIEKEKFRGFHIHIATERYQNYGGGEEDKYAEETDRYSDYDKALKCLLEDCNFLITTDPQMDLFGG